jgi:hypothetical protein
MVGLRLIFYLLVKKCDHFGDHFLTVTTQVAVPYESNETGEDPGTSPNNPSECYVMNYCPYVTQLLISADCGSGEDKGWARCLCLGS